MQEPSKDNSGDKIFVKRKDLSAAVAVATPSGELSTAEAIDRYEVTPKDLNDFVLDTHEHLIVKHDLFNHDGLTKDGIAEAFIEFAKKERLSFFL
jgi:type I restriction enzyme M protein